MKIYLYLLFRRFLRKISTYERRIKMTDFEKIIKRIKEIAEVRKLREIDKKFDEEHWEEIYDYPKPLEGEREEE